MEKIYKNAYVKEVNEDERTLVAYASTESVDRDGDIIEVGGWELDNFRKNPVLLWAHNYDIPPVGKVLWVKQENKALKFKAKFADTQMASEIWRLYKDGYLNAFSVGFLPLETENEERDGNQIRVFKRQELLEISAVPVPANPEALVADIKNGRVVIMSKILKKSLDEKLVGATYKGVVPFEHYPLLPEDEEWDAGEARRRIMEWAGGPDKDEIDWAKFRKGFAWYDSEDYENYGAYKLPHHDVSGGQLKTHWRGVAAAMAALLGARGEVDIPDSDKRGVYNHLAKHYEEYEKEPPEFRQYTEEELEELFREEKSTDYEKQIKELRKKLDELEKRVEVIEKFSLQFSETSAPQNGGGDVRNEEAEHVEIDAEVIRQAIKEVINEMLSKKRSKK